MTIRQGGTQANYTGNVQEQFIQSRLNERGYTFIPRKDFDVALYLKQPIYSRHYHIGLGIYDTPVQCDFILYHPDKWPDKLAIESKWQQSSGSVDEKFPYLVLNITLRYGCPTIVLCDGGGYKGNAEQWLRNQSSNGNFLSVFSMTEFAAWANSGNI